MSEQPSHFVESLNRLGILHWNFATAMFFQVGLLFLIIASLDLLLIRRMRAAIRYGVWSLVLVKLVLPVSLQGPLSLTGMLDSLPQNRIRIESRDTKPLAGPLETKTGPTKTFHTDPASLLSQAKDIEPNLEARESNIPFPLPVSDDAELDRRATASVQPLPQAALSMDESARPIARSVATRRATSQSIRNTMSTIRWQAWLLIGWLAAVIIYLGLFAQRVSQVRSLVLASSDAPESQASLLRDCQRLIGLGSQRIRLKISNQLGSPAICGVRHPTILFPEALVGMLDDEQMRLVFVHELLHWKRFDLAMNCVQTLLQIVYFYNPLVWITNFVIRRLREQAVDDAVLATMRSSAERYSSTLLDIVSLPHPSSSVALSLVGVIGVRRAISSRIRRILSQPILRQARLGISGIAIVVIAGLVLLPLAGRGTSADKPQPASQSSRHFPNAVRPVEKPADKPQPASDFAISGKCLDPESKDPLTGVALKLYVFQGFDIEVQLAGETKSDREGQFIFSGLIPPRSDGYFDRREYAIVAEAENRVPGMAGVSSGTFDIEYETGFSVDESGNTELMLIGSGRQPNETKEYTINLPGNPVTVRGRVIDQHGNPVPNAMVASLQALCFGPTPISGKLTGVTDKDGMFTITGLPPAEEHENEDDGNESTRSSTFTIAGLKTATLKNLFFVLHEDYPMEAVQHEHALGDVKLQLAPGCTLRGTAIDPDTGTPMAGVLVTAIGGGGDRAITDQAGRYRLKVLPGEYQIRAEKPDRVAVAITSQDCPPDQTIDLPPFRMSHGGIIAGQVVDSATGKPVVFSEESGFRIKISLIGPSQPARERRIDRGEFVEVDHEGRFRLRAAAGENYPYLLNDARGERMVTTTRKFEAVIVKEGETVNMIMRIDPKNGPAETMDDGKRIIAKLSADPAERVSQIVKELRKWSEPFERMETSCQLLRELVIIGHEALPILCEELDRTDDEAMLDNLAFVLRAIGDVRAVPALIRAIPRTLQPKVRRYLTSVNDPELLEFMQFNSQGGAAGEDQKVFIFGHPLAEVTSTLEKFTSQKLSEDDDMLGSIRASDDPRRAGVQRRLFHKEAEKWQTWWEAHWQELTDDPAFAKVNLPTDHDGSQSSPAIGPLARISAGAARRMLSPVDAEEERTRGNTHFLDLDTGLYQKWPAQIPQNEESLWTGELSAWAVDKGVDLMCVKYQPRDGEPTYALRAFNMRVWEITAHDADTIERQIRSGVLPTGKPVGDLLMHFDRETAQYDPDANAAFLFSTREGSIGLIRVTDRITQVANLRNVPENEIPKGVGTALGVKFEVNSITP